MTNTTTILFHLDRYSVAHTTVACEEYHRPQMMRMTLEDVIHHRIAVCADCEPDD